MGLEFGKDQQGFFTSQRAWATLGKTGTDAGSPPGPRNQVENGGLIVAVQITQQQREGRQARGGQQEKGNG